MANHSEGREDKDIHLGVAEKPKKVLIENGISALGSIEKCGAKITIR